MSSKDTDPERGHFQVNRHWADASQHALNSYLEANNALLTAMGLSPSSSSSSSSSTGELSAEDDPSSDAAPVVELAFGDEEWTMIRSTDEYDGLGVGEYVHFSKRLTETDVSQFAHVTGDTNRLHLEDDFAGRTRFGGRIAHGTLVAGTISAALARFPGLTIYLSQDLEFCAPVEIGEVVTAQCEIVEQLDGDQYRLETAVYDEDDTCVIDGEAVVIIDELPADGE